MKIARKCFEITILVKLGLRLAKRSFSFSLQINFGWTLLIALLDKMIFVSSFCIK